MFFRKFIVTVISWSFLILAEKIVMCDVSMIEVVCVYIDMTLYMLGNIVKLVWILLFMFDVSVLWNDLSWVRIVLILKFV